MAKLYMLRIDNEHGDFLGDFSFESERAREAFKDGWLYANHGDDANGHFEESKDFVEWETETEFDLKPGE